MPSVDILRMCKLEKAIQLILVTSTEFQNASAVRSQIVLLINIKPIKILSFAAVASNGARNFAARIKHLNSRYS
jgi:hypothetical protein